MDFSRVKLAAGVLVFLFLASFPLKAFAVSEAPTTGPEGGPSPYLQRIDPAEEGVQKPFNAGVNFDFYSRYVWRAIYWSDGIVWQPSAYISKKGFTFSTWMNMRVENEDNQGKPDEVDLIVTYENRYKNLGFKLGYMHYFYFNQGDIPDTGESFVSLVYSVGPVIKLITSHYFDVEEYRGSYYGSVGLGVSQRFNDYFLFEGALTTSLGSSKFNETYAGDDSWAWNAVQLDLSLECKPWDFFYVRPNVEYAFVPETKISDNTGNRSVFYLGLSVGLKY